MLYKKKLSIVLVILLVINLSFFNASVVQAKVYSGKAGKHVTWTYNTKTKTLTFSGKGKMYGSEHWYNDSWGDYDYSIWTRKFGEKAEKIVFKKGVTNVGGHAFLNFTRLKKIKFSSTIKVIEEYAFMGCYKLKYVKFPNRLKTIMGCSFTGCSITKLTIPNSVKTIGDEAFSGNKISSVVMPKKMTTIPERMFADNDMTTFTVPNNVKVIGEGAFEGCRKLKKINFNNKLEVVKEKAFCNCKKLESIKFNNKLNCIGNSAFEGCASLRKIELPDSLQMIDDLAFCYCSSLYNVVIPVGVENIGYGMFGGCEKLTHIDMRTNKLIEFVDLFPYPVYNYSIKTLVVPRGVKIIQMGAFQCASLNEVVVSETVEELQGYVFGNKNTNISKIVIKGKVIAKVNKTSFSNLPSDCIIYVPADCVEKYTTLFRSGGLSEKVSIVALEQK